MASHFEPHLWPDFFCLPSPSVLALCLLGAGIVWWQISEKKRAHLPPAPPGWRPLLGHLLLLGALPHQALAELAKRHAPKLMSLRLGSVLAIVASTPDAAQLLLQTHDRAFAGRPQSSVSTHLAFNGSDILFSPPNAYWRNMRQVCTTDLFSSKRIRAFQSIRINSIQSLLYDTFAQQGQVMQLRHKIMAASLDVVAKMTIGSLLSEVAPQANAVIVDMLHLGGVFNVGDFIPWLACLDLQGYEERMKRLRDRWTLVWQELVDQRRAARKPGAATEDFLDVLLSLPDLTDDNIMGVLGDMFLGGPESTSITIEWAFAELIANPAAMRQLQAELDKVVGRKRLVQEEDLPSLPYLHAVTKEAMRLHPPGPLLVPHQAMQACEVDGYLIPAKTRAIVNVWAIGRDPNVWDNPLEFQPERFMPEGKYHHVNLHGQHFELLPFGSGRRKCPGQALGLLNVHAILASLVQAFDWTLPPSTQVDSSEKFGLTMTMACPLEIIPSTPRLEASLYESP